MPAVATAGYLALPKLVIPIQGKGWVNDGRTASIVNGAFHPSIVSSGKSMSAFGAASPKWADSIDRFQSNAGRYSGDHYFDNYVYQNILCELAGNIFLHSSQNGQLELQFARIDGRNALKISAISAGSSMTFGNLLLNGWQAEEYRGRGLFSAIGYSDEFELISDGAPINQAIVKSTIYEIPHEARPPQKISFSLPVPKIGSKKSLFDVEFAGWFETLNANRQRLELISMDPGPAGRYAVWILSQIPDGGIRP